MYLAVLKLKFVAPLHFNMFYLAVQISRSFLLSEIYASGSK